jgi:hypothetical protein
MTNIENNNTIKDAIVYNIMLLSGRMATVILSPVFLSVTVFGGVFVFATRNSKDVISSVKSSTIIPTKLKAVLLKILQKPPEVK